MGYIHRDLKPENIVINLHPIEVKVIDFERSCLMQATTKGTHKGTPGYEPMSFKWVDGLVKWDLWSFCAIICEADMPKDSYIGARGEPDA